MDTAVLDDVRPFIAVEFAFSLGEMRCFHLHGGKAKQEVVDLFFDIEWRQNTLSKCQ
jgi:hypothetical protein